MDSKMLTANKNTWRTQAGELIDKADEGFDFFK